jgi:hypothetical protein
MSEFSTLKPLLQSSSDLQTSISLCYTRNKEVRASKKLAKYFANLKETTTKSIAILLLIITQAKYFA